MELTKLQQEQLEKGKLNTGLIFKEPDEKDWMLGSGIPYEVNLKDGNHLKYASKGEKQKFRNFESMNCTAFGTNNSVEMQINRMIRLDIIETEPIKDWLNSDGDFDNSDRALGKMAGNTRNGNSLNAPAEVLRTQGCPPESWWNSSDDFDWDTYYKDIPQHILDKGKELLNYFDFSYEWCSRRYVWGKGLGGLQVSQRDMMEQLKQCPIIVGTACCPGWFQGNNIISACSSKPVHCSVYANGERNKKWDNADSYPPFFKELSWWYKVPFAVKLVVKPKANILKKNNRMAKILKQTGGEGYGLLLESRNPATLMGLAESVGRTVPGEFPDDINWEALDKKLDGTYKLT